MPNDTKKASNNDLERAFEQVRQQEHDVQLTDHRAFLNQLSAIPTLHQQKATVGAETANSVLEKWLNPSFLLSVRGLISQGAFALMLLVSGLATGLEFAEAEQGFDDYDVSASLFGDETTDYSIDG